MTPLMWTKWSPDDGGGLRPGVLHLRVWAQGEVWAQITGAVVVIALPRVRVTVIVLCLAILAGLMETLQLMVPGRESDIRDFIASSAGAAAGAFAMISAIRTASRRGG